MGLLIRSSCVMGYVKVKRTLHLRFTPACKALVLAVYWLLCNKWAVYCKCGLAVRLCIMYSSTYIVNAVSLTYYTFTLSKVIVMHITLQEVKIIFKEIHRECLLSHSGLSLKVTPATKSDTFVTE